MTAAMLTVLGLTFSGLVMLFLDIRARGKLHAAQKLADAAADEAARARTSIVAAEERRERVVLAYGEVLDEVQEIAAHLQANHEPLVSARLKKLADERLAALRRLQ